MQLPFVADEQSSPKISQSWLTFCFPYLILGHRSLAYHWLPNKLVGGPTRSPELEVIQLRKLTRASNVRRLIGVQCFWGFFALQLLALFDIEALLHQVKCDHSFDSTRGIVLWSAAHTNSPGMPIWRLDKVCLEIQVKFPVMDELRATCPDIVFGPAIARHSLILLARVAERLT